MVIAIDVH